MLDVIICVPSDRWDLAVIQSSPHSPRTPPKIATKFRQTDANPHMHYLNTLGIGLSSNPNALDVASENHVSPDGTVVANHGIANDLSTLAGEGCHCDPRKAGPARSEHSRDYTCVFLTKIERVLGFWLAGS